jgi:predicted negative regulator of RcsB-dependent stress response
VAGQDLAGARQVLEEQLAKGDDEALKTLTRLRLGQVMLAQGEIEPALKLLEPASDQAVGRFAGLFAELRGDLYAAAQRSGEARQAYEKAVELGNRSPLLPLKISDLPAAE